MTVDISLNFIKRVVGSILAITNFFNLIQLLASLPG